MGDSIFHNPTKSFLGLDSVNRIGELAAPLGERAMIVTENILENHGHISRVEQLLRRKGVDCIIQDDISSKISNMDIQKIIDFTRAARVQIVVGLGGMNALSVAKAIAACGNIGLEEFMKGVPPAVPPLACILVPTAFRFPQLYSNNCFVLDELSKVSVLCRCQEGIVKGAIIDPHLTAGVSQKLTAAMLLANLASAIEGLLSQKANVVSDGLFLHAIEQIGEIIYETPKNAQDFRFKFKAQETGLLVASGIISDGPAAAIAYALHGKFAVSKSMVSAILLPHVADFFIRSQSTMFARVAKALGEDIQGLADSIAAQQVVSNIRRMMAQLKLPTRLRELDLDVDEMMDIADIASSYDFSSQLKVPVSREEIYDLIKNAF